MTARGGGRGRGSSLKSPPLLPPKAINLEIWRKMQFKREKERKFGLGLLDDDHDGGGIRVDGTAAIVKVPGTSPSQPIFVKDAVDHLPSDTLLVSKALATKANPLLNRLLPFFLDPKTTYL